MPEPVQEQPDLFTDFNALERENAAEKAELDKERRLQDALLSIKKQCLPDSTADVHARQGGTVCSFCSLGRLR